jgi:hypothetical protein
MSIDPSQRIHAIVIARSFDKGFLLEEVPKSTTSHATHQFFGLCIDAEAGSQTAGVTKAYVDKFLENYDHIHYIKVSAVPLPTYVVVAVAKDEMPADDTLHAICVNMKRESFFDLFNHSFGGRLANADVVAISELARYMHTTIGCIPINTWILEGGDIFADTERMRAVAESRRV